MSTTNKPHFNNLNCTLCGACIEVCPKNVLTIKNKKIVYTENKCMLCSHCYTVCSYNAVSFSTDELRDISIKSFKYKDGEIPDTFTKSDLLNFLRSRRSIRNYLKKPVHKDIIHDLIECAITAPSGSNSQQWQFLILDNHKKVRDLAKQIGNFFTRLNKFVKNPLVRYISFFFSGTKLIHYYNNHLKSVENALTKADEGKDLLFWGAPSVIIIHGNGLGSTPLEDAQYAAYNITLFAQLFGLGTCFIGYATHAINNSVNCKKYLGISNKNTVYCVLTIGYPVIDHKKHSLRKIYHYRYL